MTDRLHCSVPFCRRTIATRSLPKGHTEWICATHWRLVTRKAKRMKRLAYEAYEAAGIECEEIAAEVPGIRVDIFDRWRAAAARQRKKALQSNRAWERCKRQAIEAAGGLR